MEKTDLPEFFGEWLKRRRNELDLTQAELAQRAGCSVPALRKIESGDRRPSRQLAGLLARSLEISSEDQATFILVARGETNTGKLPPPTYTSSSIDEVKIKTSGPPGNLPSLLNPFIGREPEMAALDQLLRDPSCRLLTLMGPGGIGKTRLAIEIARRQEALFSDGTWFIPLAPLDSSEYLIPTIADALNFKCHGLTNPRGNLLKYLSDKQILLVMDNAEHLAESGKLFAEILVKSPQAKILVTSRQRLNLFSEWVFEIEGMPVPPNEQVINCDEYSSVALFRQSARRVRAGFQLRDDERRWVVRICQLLEGLPLGIELAAAWVSVLSCKEIANEIERTIDFLTVSMRDLPERHRSLRATLDYSWRLLSTEEKSILSRLSIFHGSFSREAAEVICDASIAALSSLLDKSFLRRVDQDRYDLHELIQRYAALRLAEDPWEEELLNDQHTLYYLNRLSNWEKALKSSKQIETLSEMAHEIGNLRQAWQHLIILTLTDSYKGSLRNQYLFQSPIFSLSLFYEMRCRNREAVSLFGQSVESLKNSGDKFDTPEDRLFYHAVLGTILGHLGMHHAYLLQYRQAEELLEDAIQLLANSSAIMANAYAQITAGWLLQIQGEIKKSIFILEKILVIFQDGGDTWGHVLASAQLAFGFLWLGEIQKGEALFQKGFRSIEPGDLRLGTLLRNGLARACFLKGEYSEAERLLEENLDLSFQLGSKRQTAICHLYLGQVALATDRFELAEMNFQRCIDLQREFGESHDLAFGLVYLGKCLVRNQETEKARAKFRRAIHIGQDLDIFHLVFWGLVNLARTLMLEGQLERALEAALILQRYSVEMKVIQDDCTSLLDELVSRLSPHQIASAKKRTEGILIETLLESITK